jgi:hypothetical protein
VEPPVGGLVESESGKGLGRPLKVYRKGAGKAKGPEATTAAAWEPSRNAYNAWTR